MRRSRAGSNFRCRSARKVRAGAVRISSWRGAFAPVIVTPATDGRSGNARAAGRPGRGRLCTPGRRTFSLAWGRTRLAADAGPRRAGAASFFALAALRLTARRRAALGAVRFLAARLAVLRGGADLRFAGLRLAGLRLAPTDLPAALLRRALFVVLAFFTLRRQSLWSSFFCSPSLSVSLSSLRSLDSELDDLNGENEGRGGAV